MIEIAGNLTLTLELGEAQALIRQGVKVVNIGEHSPELEQMGLINGNIIVPPAKLFEIKFDMKNEMAFEQEYINYLMSESLNEFICAIVTALVAQENIFLYMTKDEYELYFIPFANYLYNQFQVMIINKYANVFPQPAPYPVTDMACAQRVALAVLLSTGESALIIFDMPIMEPLQANFPQLLPYSTKLAYEFGLAEMIFTTPPEGVVASVLSVCQQYRNAKKNKYRIPIEIL